MTRPMDRFLAAPVLGPADTDFDPAPVDPERRWLSPSAGFNTPGDKHAYDLELETAETTWRFCSRCGCLEITTEDMTKEVVSWVLPGTPAIELDCEPECPKSVSKAPPPARPSEEP